jgi:hypothetical protein
MIDSPLVVIICALEDMCTAGELGARSGHSRVVRRLLEEPWVPDGA